MFSILSSAFFISLISVSVIFSLAKATTVTSLFIVLVTFSTFKDATNAIAITISVILIQEIDAIDKEKFLITLLNASLMLRANILNGFIIIPSFLIVFY